MAPGIGTDCKGSWSEACGAVENSNPARTQASVRPCLQTTVPHRACQIPGHLQTRSIGPAFPFKLGQVNPPRGKAVRTEVEGPFHGLPEGGDPCRAKFGPSKTTHPQSLGSSQWPGSPVPTPNPVLKAVRLQGGIVGFARRPAGILRGEQIHRLCLPLWGDNPQARHQRQARHFMRLNSGKRPDI